MCSKSCLNSPPKILGSPKRTAARKPNTVRRCAKQTDRNSSSLGAGFIPVREMEEERASSSKAEEAMMVNRPIHCNWTTQVDGQMDAD